MTENDDFCTITVLAKNVKAGDCIKGRLGGMIYVSLRYNSTMCPGYVAIDTDCGMLIFHPDEKVDLYVSRKDDAINKYILIINENLRIFELGLKEHNSDIAVTYDNDPFSDKSVAYDLGRALGEALFGNKEVK